MQEGNLRRGGCKNDIHLILGLQELDNPLCGVFCGGRSHGGFVGVHPYVKFPHIEIG